MLIGTNKIILISQCLSLDSPCLALDFKGPSLGLAILDLTTLLAIPLNVLVSKLKLKLILKFIWRIEKLLPVYR